MVSEKAGKKAGLRLAAEGWALESIRALTTHGISEKEAAQLMGAAVATVAYQSGEMIQLNTILESFQNETEKADIEHGTKKRKRSKKGAR